MDNTSNTIPSPYLSEGLLEALDHQRRVFSHLKSNLLSRYLEKAKDTSPRPPRLVSFNGWAHGSGFIPTGPCGTLPTQAIERLFRIEAPQARAGGYWLHLGNQGIAINPGKNFLRHFHEAGLHIWDLHHVIVTDGSHEASEELTKIYQLNSEINSFLKEWNLEPHVIQYWLHPHAFERYSASLRPIYRQEQGSVHRLDMFCDALSCEKVELSPNILLTYIGGQQAYAIKLQLHREKDPYSVGFFLETTWSDAFLPLIDPIDLLVLGIGELSFEDIAQAIDGRSSLGYGGALKALKAARRQSDKKIYALFSEYGMKDGDFRIESLKQMRADLLKSSSEQEIPHILPSERLLSFLLEGGILESAPGIDRPTNISHVRVLRRHGPFSELIYVSNEHVL